MRIALICETALSVLFLPILNQMKLSLMEKTFQIEKTIIVCNVAVQLYIQFFHIAENLLLSNDAFFS